MKKELEDKIFNEFPDMFKDRGNLHASLMAFGFECSDGWFDLIYNLCKDINDFYKGKIPEHFSVVQVKEKFGSLRFYISAAPEEVHNMINAVEEKSYSICEQCSKPGRYRDGLSWILTLCDKCLDEHIKTRYHRERKKDEDFISDWQKEHKAPFVKGS